MKGLFVCAFKGRIAPLPDQSNPYLQSLDSGRVVFGIRCSHISNWWFIINHDEKINDSAILLGVFDLKLLHFPVTSILDYTMGEGYQPYKQLWFWQLVQPSLLLRLLIRSLAVSNYWRIVFWIERSRKKSVEMWKKLWRFKRTDWFSLTTLDSGINVPPGITVAPPLKIFYITILILFYINLGIAVIFNFFCPQTFSKINKRTPMFILESKVGI